MCNTHILQTLCKYTYMYVLKVSYCEIITKIPTNAVKKLGLTEPGGKCNVQEWQIECSLFHISPIMSA